MLTRLEAVKNVKHGRQLVDVILKLLSYAVKLQSNRRYLAQPSLKALNVLLGSLNLVSLCLDPDLHHLIRSIESSSW